MQEHILRINNLLAGYGKQQVLHDITLSVNPGEVAALIGPNGSGKSTLLKTISGVLPVWNGNIHIDGYNTMQITSQERARLISVIPQARNLPPAFTAREVVSLGRTPYVSWLGKLKKEDVDQIEQAMSRTDTLHLANRQMGELSGGEQQRVLVARAIAQQPKVLLLDEPTTHLDVSYQHSLMKLVVSLAHQDHVTVLMAVHDLDLVSVFADSAFLLVSGRIVAAGTPENVLQRNILRQVYKVDMEVEKLESGKLHVYIS